MFSGVDLDINAHRWLTVFIALSLSLGAAYWAYRRTNPPLSPGRTALLFILRAAALAILALVLLEPILGLVWRRVEQPVVAVLVDVSASMSIPEQDGDRLAQARAFLDGSILRQAAADDRLVTYRFAEQALPWAGDSLVASGRATDIAGALETVRRELEESNLAAVVVLTDGASNLGRDPAQLARTYGLPIFPVGIGSTEPGQDISLKEVLTADVVYVDSRVPVEVTVQSQGLEGLQVPVTLQSGQEVLDSRPVVLEGGGREQKLSLEYVPKEEGLIRLKISLPLQDGELVGGNNSRELAVRALKSKIKVLLIWGSPSWDFSFLRRSLEGDPNVELVPLAAKGRQGYFLGTFPQSESQLWEYDVIILGDSAPLNLTSQQEQWLARMINQEGKGLLVIGGPRFDLAQNSPLEELIPLSLAAKRAGAMEDRFWVQLTSAGRVHPVMAVEEDALEPERIWQDIPPFLGLNPLGPAKTGATVLAVHPELRVGEEPLPLIAGQQVGMGKTLLVAVYPLWRWEFMLSGLDWSPQTYHRFWSNCVRWLSTREESRRVRVYPQGHVFRSGQRIGFEARLYDQSYRPMDRAQVKVVVAKKQSPGEVEAEGDLFESGQRDGLYRGELPVLSPGEYLYRAEVFLAGQKMGQDEGEFLVEEYSLEFDRVELNQDLLREMARASGGAYFRLDETASLPERLQFQSREVSQRREIELWNHPTVLVTLVVLLAAEWVVRKRNRLM